MDGQEEIPTSQAFDALSGGREGGYIFDGTMLGNRWIGFPPEAAVFIAPLCDLLDGNETNDSQGRSRFLLQTNSPVDRPLPVLEKAY